MASWWSAVISTRKYSVLSPVIKACKSIFTGPRVEMSFSVMNLIVNPCANKMLVSTYESIHKLKYKFLNSDKSSCELYKRADPVLDPVDKAVCWHLQTAYRRHKSTADQKPKKPLIKKFKIHKTAELAKNAIEANAKEQSSDPPVIIHLDAHPSTSKNPPVKSSSSTKEATTESSLANANKHLQQAAVSKNIVSTKSNSNSLSASKSHFPIFAKKNDHRNDKKT